MDNKERITNQNETATIVKVETTTEVKSVIFLLFAEFLGYESPLIEWAEKACDGIPSHKFVENILNMEACTIFNKMKKEYTIEEIKSWYNQFYPLVLEAYEEKLKEAETSNLPF